MDFKLLILYVSDSWFRSMTSLAVVDWRNGESGGYGGIWITNPSCN